MFDKNIFVVVDIKQRSLLFVLSKKKRTFVA